MSDDLDAKVVLKQIVLRGSHHPELLQRVALVYMNGTEFRVYAPPGAEGDAAEWVRHWSVATPDPSQFASELVADGALGVLAKKLVLEAIEKQKRDANRAGGMNADGDGIHCDAQICLRGHIVHCDGGNFDSKAYCTKCGASCIDECPHCKEPIRGAVMHQRANSYALPLYCHKCGRAYPWMEDRLNAARELLRHDEQLTPDDRIDLFNDLQLVMSDPKSALAPARNKLIKIKLQKATAFVREGILELLAKTAAELIKSP